MSSLCFRFMAADYGAWSTLPIYIIHLHCPSTLTIYLPNKQAKIVRQSVSTTNLAVAAVVTTGQWHSGCR